MIHIISDYRELDKEFDRLDGMPDARMNIMLDAVLAIGLKQTQAATHVITGSLKSSMKSDSEERRSSWIGTITAGGPSLGINNPVDYAIYEKARGGDHDFFGNLHLLHSLYILAIKNGLRK